MSRKHTSHKLNRRAFLAGTAAGTAAASFGIAAPAIAQNAPFKIGLLTVKTGPLAQGGNQMEQGIATLLKQKNNTLAGRKVELISADTGGSQRQDSLARRLDRHGRRAAQEPLRRGRRRRLVRLVLGEL
jgi:ABC-type branched-subunit amino acid transport system substrate-binding protein